MMLVRMYHYKLHVRVHACR